MLSFGWTNQVLKNSKSNKNRANVPVFKRYITVHWTVLTHVKNYTPSSKCHQLRQITKGIIIFRCCWLRLVSSSWGEIISQLYFFVQLLVFCLFVFFFSLRWKRKSSSRQLLNTNLYLQNGARLINRLILVLYISYGP